MTDSYRIDLLRDGVVIGTLPAASLDVKFSAEASVKLGLQAAIIAERDQMSQLDLFRDRLKPVLIHDGREHSLGIYMIMACPKTVYSRYCELDVEAYDETMRLKEASFEKRMFFDAGTTYFSAILSMLVQCGITNYISDTTKQSVTLPDAVEFEAGTTYLDAINELLDGIGYEHIYTDFNGRFHLASSTDKSYADFSYTDRNAAVIEKVKEDTDLYSLPNVLIGVYSSPDSDDPVVYTKINDNPLSKVSTVNRGYKVAQIYKLDNISSQAALKEYIDKKCLKAMQMTESVEFTTAPEPEHEFGSSIMMDVGGIKGLFSETSWDIRISKGMSSMTHRAERRIFI